MFQWLDWDKIFNQISHVARFNILSFQFQNNFEISASEQKEGIFDLQQSNSYKYIWHNSINTESGTETEAALPRPRGTNASIIYCTITVDEILISDAVDANNYVHFPSSFAVQLAVLSIVKS